MNSIRSSHFCSQNGSVLVVALGLVGILALVSASLMEMVSQEQRLSHRSMAWNQAAFAAETGIEYGWNEMNKLTGINTNSAFMSGWTYIGSTTWTRSNQQLTPLAGHDEPSTIASLTVNTNSPAGQTTITSVGQTTSALISKTITRTVQATLRPTTPFNMAMLAKGLIDFSGSTAQLDSFNSANGAWSVDTRLARGDIGTNGLLIDAAGMTVYGSMQTGPGGEVTEDPKFTQKQGADTASAADDSRVNGISDGLKTSIPDVSLPSGLSAVASGGAVTADKTVTAAAGATTQVKYDSVTLGGSDKLVIDGASANGATQGKIQIYVTGSLSIGGSASISVTNTLGGPLPQVEFYVGGPAADLLGNGIVGTSKPADMLIYGLPGLTSLQVGGTADFTGAIYAPNADVKLNGNVTYTGSLTGSTITIPGGPQFHYDEALQGMGFTLSYMLATWKEL